MMKETENIHTERSLSIPELRFPEFEGGLKKRKLIDIAKGKLNNGIFNDPSKVGSGYYLINVKDMYLDLSIDKTKLTRINIAEKEFLKNQVKYGDIFFTRSSLVKEGIAYSVVNLNSDEDITYDGHLIKLSPDNKIINPFYLATSLKTSNLRKQLISRGKTGTMTTIGQEDIASVKINLPSLPEQQKIASFLTAVDDKINQLSKKAELLEEYKKGVMQKIFKQEIRFKDHSGQVYTDWEEKKLGEVTYKVGKKNKGNVKYPIYSINNQVGFIPQSDQFEGMDSNNRGYDISMYKIIGSNTWAYNPARINVGSIGFSGELDNIIISSLYVCFKTNEDLEDSFLKYYLQTYNFNKAVLRNVEGGVRDYLFYENFSSIIIPLPSNSEQQKIASFLTSIDQKIEQVNTQLEKAKIWKKGLLQKMFV
jgi:type I restriction enzyme S subunit